MQLKEFQKTELTCNQSTKLVVEDKTLKVPDIVEPLCWIKNTLQLMPQACTLCHQYVQHLFAASFGKLETTIPGLFPSLPRKVFFFQDVLMTLKIKLMMSQAVIAYCF